MRVVVFGRSVSSSWGNGHATLWRGLARALERAGGELLFFERDQPFYSRTRDATELPGIHLIVYKTWDEIRAMAVAAVRSADLALVTSYCPDGPDAADLVRAEAEVSGFYDMDTPTTLSSPADAAPVPYLPRGGLSGFDLVLSYTGGRALGDLARQLGAERVHAFYGSVDPELYAPLRRSSTHAALSHLGAFVADRADALEALFLATARRLPDLTFLLGGAHYPERFSPPPNVVHLPHVSPPEHRAFFSAAPLTLNITHGAMAAYGYCPSGRMFEAAACGTAVVSDAWAGLETFFTPSDEILIARTSVDMLDLLAMGPRALATVGRRARERVLAEHTSDHRVRQLMTLTARAKEFPRGAGTAKNAPAVRRGGDA